MTLQSNSGLFTVVLLLVFCSYFSHAQQGRLDSLNNVLPALRGNARIDCLCDLSEVYRYLGTFDSSASFALRAAKESEMLQYEFGKAEAYYNLGYIDYETSDFAGSEASCHLAIEIFGKNGSERQLARAYSLLGLAIWAQSKFDRANEAFEQANALFTQLGDSAGIGETYTRMALAEGERGNYEKSFEYCLKALSFKSMGALIALGQLHADVGDYETALKYYDSVKGDNYRMQLYLRVGEVYFLKNQYDSSIHFYRMYIAEQINPSRYALSKPHVLLGSVYLSMKSYDSALYYIQSALSEFRAVNNRNWIMRSLLALGRTYKEIGNLKAAAASAQELLTTSTEYGARQYIRDARHLLFQLADAVGDKTKAYIHLKEYTSLNNAIDIEVSARKLAFFNATNEREQSQLKIALLANEQQLQQQELDRSMQQNRFLFASILGLALVGIVLVMNILLKKRNETNLRKLAENELQIQKLESSRQLSELEMQVLRTQMNPHFIFNSLNSINRFILQNNKAQATEYLTQFSRLVRMILQDSKNKSIPLQRELDSLELYLSLEALRFDNHFSYKITIGDDVDVSVLKVPPLIVQPYAENAVWHGLMNKKEGGHLRIDVATENQFLVIKISDDGIGRKRAANLAGQSNTSHKSMGLDITSQRIAMTHGEMQVQSVIINDLVGPDGDPCGTEVILKLPVAYD